MPNPRDADAPVVLDHPAEDRARATRSVADLVEEDRLDPSTPDHFEVDLEPVDPPSEKVPDGG
jgi:hypothetical protein